MLCLTVIVGALLHNCQSCEASKDREGTRHREIQVERLHACHTLCNGRVAAYIDQHYDEPSCICSNASP